MTLIERMAVALQVACPDYEVDKILKDRDWREMAEAALAVLSDPANITDEMMAVHEAMEGEPIDATAPNERELAQCREYFAKNPIQLRFRKRAFAAALAAAGSAKP